jgi:peptide/nickel transport system substrate-binding protein
VFLTNATATGVENPLVNNFVKNCAEAWYHWACDQRIVDLNRQWALEADPAKRKQITDELQRVHLENVTLVPLGMYRPTIIYRKELVDIIPAPAIFYWNIKKRGGA